MEALASFKERLAASREQWVKIGMIEVLLHRPSQLRLAELQDLSKGANSYVVLLTAECVRAWKGVKASDLLPPDEAFEGEDSEVAYQPELLDALMGNQVIGPLFAQEFAGWWMGGEKKKEAAAKN